MDAPHREEMRAGRLILAVLGVLTLALAVVFLAGRSGG